MANSINPWLGLTAYSEAESAWFRGRATEVEELQRLVDRATLTVLYGISGLGKTSLLRGGLFPALRAVNALPVYLRLDFSETAADLSEQVITALEHAAATQGIEAPAHAGASLWEWFHRSGQRFWTRHHQLVTPVIVFDQFEELFTQGRQSPARRARAEEFIASLAALVNNDPPATVAAGLDEGTVDPAEYDFEAAPLKIILSLREDFLAHLSQLCSAFPTIRQNELRLLPFSLAQAREVIEQPGSELDLLAPGATEAILRFASAAERAGESSVAPLEFANERPVDPALLSVLLRELEVERTRLGLPRITAELLTGSHEQILLRYYERSLEGVSDHVRRLIEDELVSPGGFRDSRALDDVLQRRGISPQALDGLVDRRVLRYEESGSNLRRVELTHDVLCGVVRTSGRLRRSRQLRRRNRLLVITIIFLLVTFGASWAIPRATRGPGHPSANHAAFAEKCSVCHESPENRVLKSLADIPKIGWLMRSISPGRIGDGCVRCHPASQFHQPGTNALNLREFYNEIGVVQAESCFGCHREHEGPGRMSQPPRDNCQSCHSDLSRMAKNLTLLKSTAPMASPHGEVRTFKLGAQNDGVQRFIPPRAVPHQPIAIDSFATNHPAFGYEQPGLSDVVQFNFNHSRHRQSDVAAMNNGLQIDCSNCHKLGADGAFTQRISFNGDCRSCHALQFDPDVPEMEVPHGSPQGVRDYLVNLVSAYQLAGSKRGIPANKLQEFVGKRMAALGQQFQPGDDAKLALERRIFFGNGGATACRKCHTLQTGEPGILPLITPSNIADRWLTRGPFTHAPHLHMQCIDCHGAALTSTKANDILLPGKALCAECHRPTDDKSQDSAVAVRPFADPNGELVARQRRQGGAPSECQTCHGKYHPPAEAAVFATQVK